MANLRKIGSAFVDIFVKKDRLSQGLKSAEAEVKASSEKMSDSVSGGLGKGLGAVGKAIEDKTAGLRKFTGAISAAVGAATALLGVITAIGAIIGTLVLIGQKIAEEWGRAAKQAAEYRAQVEAAAASQKRIELDLFGTSASRQAAQIKSQYTELIKAIFEQIEGARRESNEALVQDLLDQWRDAERKVGEILEGIASRGVGDPVGERISNERYVLEQEILALKEEGREQEAAQKQEALRRLIAAGKIAELEKTAPRLAREAAEFEERRARAAESRIKSEHENRDSDGAHAEMRADNARKEHAAEMERIAEVKRAQLEAIMESRRAAEEAIRKMGEGLGGASGLRALRDLPAILDSMNGKMGTGY